MSSRLRIVRRRHFSVPLLVQIASRIGPRLPSLVCREQIEIIGGVLDACAQPFQGRPWRSFVMGPSSPPPTMGGCHTQPQLVEHVRQRADDLLHLQPDDVSSGAINVKQPMLRHHRHTPWPELGFTKLWLLMSDKLQTAWGSLHTGVIQPASVRLVPRNDSSYPPVSLSSGQSTPECPSSPQIAAL